MGERVFLMSIQEVSAEQLAKLFHHYPAQVRGDSDGRVYQRSISGTIGETLPSLSPRTWAGFWLYDQLDTRVMGAGITARKKSHGGSCPPRDIGSGFNNKRTRRPEALFCKAGGGRVGLLGQRTRRERPPRLDRQRRR